MLVNGALKLMVSPNLLFLLHLLCFVALLTFFLDASVFLLQANLNYTIKKF